MAEASSPNSSMAGNTELPGDPLSRLSVKISGVRADLAFDSVGLRTEQLLPCIMGRRAVHCRRWLLSEVRPAVAPPCLSPCAPCDGVRADFGLARMHAAVTMMTNNPHCGTVPCECAVGLCCLPPVQLCAGLCWHCHC